jgi:hypothetical protein
MPEAVVITGSQLLVAVLALAVIFTVMDVFTWLTLEWFEDRREARAKRPPLGARRGPRPPMVALPEHTAEEAELAPWQSPPREFDHRQRTPRRGVLVVNSPGLPEGYTPPSGSLTPPVDVRPAAGDPPRFGPMVTPGGFAPSVPEEARRQWGRTRWGLHYLDCPSGLHLQPLPEILSWEQAMQYAAEQPLWNTCAICHVGDRPRPRVPVQERRRS